MLRPGQNLARSSYRLYRTRIPNLTTFGQDMAEILAFIRFLVLFGLVWFGLAQVLMFWSDKHGPINNLTEFEDNRLRNA